MKIVSTVSEKIQKIRTKIEQKIVRLMMGSFMSPLHH